MNDTETKKDLALDAALDVDVEAHPAAGTGPTIADRDGLDHKTADVAATFLAG